MILPNQVGKVCQFIQFSLTVKEILTGVYIYIYLLYIVSSKSYMNLHKNRLHIFCSSKKLLSAGSLIISVCHSIKCDL